MNVLRILFVIITLIFSVSCERTPNENKENLYKISFESTILPDELYINGKQVQNANSIKLKLGEYKFVAKKAGYKSIEKTVKVATNDKSIKFDWQPLDSKWEIVVNYSFPPKSKENTTIQYKSNGEFLSAQTINTVKPGDYVLEINHDGFKKVEKNINVKVGSKTVTEVTLEALPRNCKIEVFSTKNDKEIKIENFEAWINGKKANQIAVGEQTIKIKADGYKTKEEKVNVAPSNETFVQKFLLEKAEPKKCEVFVNVLSHKKEKLAAETITLNGLDAKETIKVLPGDYELVIQHPGYEKIKKNVHILGNIYNITETLSPSKINLQFKVVSNGTKIAPDEILINGKNFEGRILPGKYNVIIKKNSYNDVKKEINVELGMESLTFDIEMQKSLKKINIQFVDDKTNESISVQNFYLDGNLYQNTSIEIIPQNSELIVEKEGYEKFSEKVNFNDVDTYEVRLKKSILPRKLFLSVTSDIDSSKTITPQMVLVNEQDYVEDLLVKPGTYKILVLAGGHDTFEKQIEIPEGKDRFEYSITLNSRLRKVEPNIIYDIQPLNTDCYLTLSQDQKVYNIGSGTLVKPGKYKIEVKKEGYSFSGNTEVFIRPNEETYQLTIALKKSANEDSTKPTEKIENGTDTDVKENDPTKLTEKLENGTDTDVKENDPTKLTEKIENGTDTDVKENDPTKLTEKIENGTDTDVKENDPTKLTEKIENGTDTDVKENDPTKLTEKIENGTDTDVKENDPAKLADLIKKELENTKCKIVVKASTNFPGAKVEDVQIFVNGKDAHSHLFSEGTYDVVIQADGYKTTQERVTIEKGQKELTIQKELLVNKRQVSFSFKNEQGFSISPDMLFVDGQTFSGKLFPGKHIFTFQAKGYDNLEEEIIVDFGNTTQYFEKVVSKKKYSINLNFTDKNNGTQITDVSVFIDDKEITDTKIKLPSGVYKVTLKKEDYQDHSFDLKVLSENLTQNVTLEKIQKEAPVVIEINVKSDSNLDQNITPELLMVNNMPYNAGLSLLPGEHHLVVYNSGHEPYDKKINVTSDSEKFVIDVVLASTLRTLEIEYKYDVKPSLGYPDCEVNLTNKASNQKVDLNGLMIKPGSYNLDIKQAGYTYQGEKEIFIEPSMEPYTLQISLKLTKEDKEPTKETKKEEVKATSRKLKAVAIHPDTLERIYPYQFLVNGKTYMGEALAIGTEVTVEILFSKYKTYRGTVKVEPGSKDLEIKVPLITLKRIVLTSDTDKEIYDGIEYKYGFKIDKNPAESHLINVVDQGGKYSFYIYVDPNAKDVQIHCGYRFIERSLIKENQRVGYLSRFDSNAVTEHLDKVIESLGEKVAMKRIEKIMRYDSTIKKYWNYVEKENFLYYIEEKIQDSSLMSKRDRIIGKLESMLE